MIFFIRRLGAGSRDIVFFRSGSVAGAQVSIPAVWAWIMGRTTEKNARILKIFFYGLLRSRCRNVHFGLIFIGPAADFGLFNCHKESICEKRRDRWVRRE
jgi:hypothetical protein